MRLTFSTLSLTLIAGAASADVTLSVPLELGAMDSVTSHNYTCADGEEFAVQYVNAGANVLAILPIQDEDRIFVNVVAGSGAKYVSGAHVWWTKGTTATLQNELGDGGNLDCQAQDIPRSK